MIRHSQTIDAVTVGDLSRNLERLVRTLDLCPGFSRGLFGRLKNEGVIAAALIHHVVAGQRFFVAAFVQVVVTVNGSFGRRRDNVAV